MSGLCRLHFGTVCVAWCLFCLKVSDQRQTHSVRVAQVVIDVQVRGLFHML